MYPAAILFMRLYGFSGRDKRILVLSSILVVGFSCVSIALLVIFYRSVSYLDWPMLHVCIIAGGNHKLLGIIFTLLLSNGFIAMLGMLFIMYQKYQAHRSSLINAFYRDGIGFFMGLSVLALTNVVLNFAPGVWPNPLILQADTDK
ncbi:hypothetical protein MD484_g7543, partial [Candolleomyces efflorescens]